MKNEKWTNEECEKLINIHENFSDGELAEIFNRSINAIQCKKRRLGLTKNINKKDRGDQHFFDIIDTQEKAYWLGFIYADGYIIKSSKNYELGIELSIKDINHLNKFNKIFNNYYKVSTKIGNYNSIDRMHNRPIANRIYKSCVIRVYSKSIYEGLAKNGIIQNKTNSNVFPKIDDDDLFLHFLRGYIDGDGSYSIKKIKKYKYPRISIESNNKKILEHISKRLKETFNIKSSIHSDKSCFKLEIYKTNDCINLINLMFDNATIYLDRKFDKICELKSIAV